MRRTLRGRTIFGGTARGRVLSSKVPVSFFGGVDPDTGVVMEPGHPLQGRCLAQTVLVFPHGKGSTVGSYTLYRLARNGVAPAAIINAECETIVAVGAIIAEIPCVDQIDLSALAADARVEVDATAGIVYVDD